MTNYERYLEMAEQCAKTACAATDENLAAFYRSAAEGFKIKARKIPLKDIYAPLIK